MRTASEKRVRVALLGNLTACQPVDVMGLVRQDFTAHQPRSQQLSIAVGVLMFFVRKAAPFQIQSGQVTILSATLCQKLFAKVDHAT